MRPIIKAFLAACCYDLQIFRLNLGDPILGLVVGRPELFQLLAQRRPAGFIQRLKSPVRGAIVQPKRFHHVSSAEGKIEADQPASELEVSHIAIEPFADSRFIAQRTGEGTPAGGGTCLPTILNIWPMKPVPDTEATYYEGQAIIVLAEANPTQAVVLFRYAASQ